MSEKSSGDMPVPQGDYVPARRHGDMIFTSGMTPRRNGVMLLSGPVKINVPVEDYREAVRLAARNAVQAAAGLLDEGEAIATVLSLTVYIVAEPGFSAHARLADLASAFIRETLGPGAIGSRAAIGVATLPGNAPVEIQMVVAVGTLGLPSR